jgi:uncharacterized membrane protein YfhO
MGAPVGRADYTFIGVPLVEGARRIELTFRERNYEVGRAITLLSLAASLALILWGIRDERRRRRA